MWDKYIGILLYMTEIYNGVNFCNLVLKHLVKECRVLIFKHVGSGHKHNDNSNDSGGGDGGGSIQCSLSVWMFYGDIKSYQVASYISAEWF